MSDFTLTIGGHAVAAQQTFGVIDPATDFGGAEESGMGVENGPWGMAEFTSAQVLNVKKD